MAATPLCVDGTSMPGHKKWCKCVGCKVGVLDKARFLAIPPVGECQGCHKKIDNVVAGQACPHCGFGGKNVQTSN